MSLQFLYLPDKLPLFTDFSTFTKSLYLDWGVFEWVERGGSYGCLFALWLLTPRVRHRKNNNTVRVSVTSLISVVCLFFISCKDQHAYIAKMHDPMLYNRTVKKLNDIVLENNFPPMVASRNYAYANIAAYEVNTAGDSNYRSLSGQIKHFPPMPRPSEEVD